VLTKRGISYEPFLGQPGVRRVRDVCLIRLICPLCSGMAAQHFFTCECACPCPPSLVPQQADGGFWKCLEMFSGVFGGLSSFWGCPGGPDGPVSIYLPGPLIQALDLSLCTETLIIQKGHTPPCTVIRETILARYIQPLCQHTLPKHLIKALHPSTLSKQGKSFCEFLSFTKIFLFNVEFRISPFWGHPGCEVPHV